jgi:hypothetical protein
VSGAAKAKRCARRELSSVSTDLQAFREPLPGRPAGGWSPLKTIASVSGGGGPGWSHGAAGSIRAFSDNYGNAIESSFEELLVGSCGCRS